MSKTEAFRNPFTPSFGKIPPFMAGREDIVDDILDALDEGPGNPYLSTVFVGARGTGKTALVSYLAQEAGGHGWISVNVSAVPGMLEDIVEQTVRAGSGFVEKPSKARLEGLTLGPFGASWTSGNQSHGNWRTRMSPLLDQLQERGIGLLMTIDEVRADLDEMILLASTYQHFVREDRKVALLMAGLPYKVSQLLSDDSVSFLRRSQYYRLGTISDIEIAEAFTQTVEQGGRAIEDDALEYAVERIGGFPYMMQLVGWRSWRIRPTAASISLEDVQRGANWAAREIEEKMLAETYRDLSAMDQRFLAAMLEDKRESALTDIAKRMGVTSSYASTYKRRLLEQGVVSERGWNNQKRPESDALFRRRLLRNKICVILGLVEDMSHINVAVICDAVEHNIVHYEHDMEPCTSQVRIPREREFNQAFLQHRNLISNSTDKGIGNLDTEKHQVFVDETQFAFSSIGNHNVTHGSSREDRQQHHLQDGSCPLRTRAQRGQDGQGGASWGHRPRQALPSAPVVKQLASRSLRPPFLKSDNNMDDSSYQTHTANG